MIGPFNKKKRLRGLLDALDRLIAASQTGDFNIKLNDENLSSIEANAVNKLKNAIDNYKRALEYENMKYKLTSDSLGVALWDMDITDGDPFSPDSHVRWSDDLRRMLGFTDERDFPNNIEAYVACLHPDDKDFALDNIAKHVLDRTGKTPYNFNVRLKLKNGTYRHFHALGNTVRTEAGVPYRAAGALEDINDRVQTQEALKKENEMMANSDLRLNLLVEGMNIALWDMAVDPEEPNPVDGSNTVWWSKEFRKALKFADEHDFPNFLSSWSGRIHPEDEKNVLSALAAHITDRSGKTPFDLEHRIKLKTGEYRHFHVFGSTMRDGKGRALRVAGAIKDITEQKLIEERLKANREQIEDNDRRIKKIMENVKTVGENVASGAKQISDSSQELAGGVSTQANAISELNDGFEVINRQMQLTVQNMTKANELSKNAKKNAISGNEEMRTLLGSIEGIKDASRNIAKIIKTIEEISFQTNLLSLNAAVEAARAGEHGKGFAVVASEVKTLAERSQKAAKETASLITDTVNRVENGTEIAVKTASTFETIIENFESVSSIVDEIALIADKQSENVAQAVAGIEQISVITQSNSAASQESAAASQQLASQSETLVNLFKNI